MLKASVIIPHLNNFDLLEKCLKALEQQTIGRQNFEIILVDNGSTGFEAKEYLNRVDKLLQIKDKNNPYVCRNAGIKAALSPLVILLDAKCIPYQNWIEEGLKCLNGGFKMVAGRFDVVSGPSIFESCYGLIYLDNYHLNKLNAGFPAGNLFIKKELFDAFGLFSEDRRSAEDIRWTKFVINQKESFLFCQNASVQYYAKGLKETLNSIIRDIGGIKSFQKDIPWKMLFPMNPGILNDKIRRIHPDFTYLKKIGAFLYIWFLRVFYFFAYFTVK